jgi:hypothetical protein
MHRRPVLFLLDIRLAGSVVDPNSFFSDWDPHFFSISDSDPYTNILVRNCIKWCISLLSCVFWNLYDRQIFPNYVRFFSFKYLICDFSPTIYFTTVSGSKILIRNFFRIRIQPKYSDSFGFGSTFGSTTLLAGYPANQKSGYRISSLILGLTTLFLVKKSNKYMKTGLTTIDFCKHQIKYEN